MTELKSLSSRSSRRRTALAGLPLSLLVVLAAGLLLAGCGDDDDDGNGMTNSELMEQQLVGLQTFALQAGSGSEVQLMMNPVIGDLFNTLGISIGDLVANGFLPLDVETITNIAPDRANRGMSFAAAQIPFGTYARDVTYEQEPFPGWRPVAPNNPPNGFIFTFEETDDIQILDENGSPVNVAGEIRFLNVEIDPVNEIPTAMTFEIQIDGMTPAPLIRIAIAIDYDDMLEPVLIQIGDENDLNSTYIGLLSFAVFLQSTSDVSGEDIEARLQLVDREQDPDYVIRLELTIDDLHQVGEDEIPDSGTIAFGFGPTNTPTSPPMVITVTLDNFVYVPAEMDYVADVDGNIVYNARVIATFAGTTAEVPVNYDVNRDGQINAEDTCPNVMITFVGEGGPMNICEALGEAITIVNLPLLGAGPSWQVGPFGF